MMELIAFAVEDWDREKYHDTFIMLTIGVFEK